MSEPSTPAVIIAAVLMAAGLAAIIYGCIYAALLIGA